jgi:Tol biopolymer transport system component
MGIWRTSTRLPRASRLIVVVLTVLACTVAPVVTPTPSPSPTATPTPSPTASPVPTAFRTASPMPTPPATPSSAPSPTHSQTPGPVSTTGRIAFFSHGEYGPELYVIDADGSNLVRLSGPNDYLDCAEADIDKQSLAWSPDGTRLAYVAGCRQASRLEIRVVNADGSGLANLTDSGADQCNPAWSPDGSKIAFVSRCDGATRKRQIYVINADGSGLARLSNNRASDLNPVWSPDGNRIGFVSVGRPFGFCEDAGLYWCGPPWIYVMNADGSARRNLTRSGANSWGLAWSPDGTRIAFETSARRPCVELLEGCFGIDPEVFVMAADGLGVFNLSNYGFDPRIGSYATDIGPVWSPDGSRIAFTSDRDGDSEIYVTDADGTNVVNVTNNDVIDVYPAWSPDGSRIAFVSPGGDHTSVYVMNADGSAVVELTRNWGHYVAYPVWSPVLSQ